MTADREAAICERRDQTIEPWEKHEGVTCVECPRCAFTFDDGHRDADREDVHYSCPVCGEGRALEDGDAARQEAHRLSETTIDLEAELAAARDSEYQTEMQRRVEAARANDLSGQLAAAREAMAEAREAAGNGDWAKARQILDAALEG